ncbi:YdcF family protein [Paenibacillus sp. UNC451MF]|uniref:YdcF family protein n=1 Tax=Paenibacillus sp. UNC451MF TaxID=1449063 RepID=UPI000691CC07|nr:YdcF family protein [Paenibacillus sp. UNC451MF]
MQSKVNKKRSLFTRLMSWLSRVVRLALVLVILCLIWTVYLLWRMESFPDNPQARGDVGIVLGAALWQNIPSPALKERLNRAVELYRTGQIQQILVSGGLDSVYSKLTEAEGMRNYLLEQGIPNSAIVMEKQSTSTYENLLYSQRLFKQYGWHSAVIITHRYHAVRAMDIAKFLEYDQLIASPMDSAVLMMSWHKSREILAWTKWELDKVLLNLGIESKPMDTSALKARIIGFIH